MEHEIRMKQIDVNASLCIGCGRCVRVCPSAIFVQSAERSGIGLQHLENCLVCGHCVAACPVGAVRHEAFPPQRVHPVAGHLLPDPEQVELLLAMRRSNRALRPDPVPQELLERIVAAADLAPTATNARNLEYTLVTDPERLKEVTEYTLGVFQKIEKRLRNPFLKPWLERLAPALYRYLPVFERLRLEYAAGRDRILRGATALLVVHAPLKSRFASEDGNLAYQNASIMAEALGVSQIYMGFVLTAIRRDGGGPLVKRLGLEGRKVCAVMALGMPQFRFPNYVDREAAPVCYFK